MTVFLVISSLSAPVVGGGGGSRREVDILLVVTFPQHRNDEDAPDNHHGELCHSSKDKKTAHAQNWQNNLYKPSLDQPFLELLQVCIKALRSLPQNLRLPKSCNSVN